VIEYTLSAQLLAVCCSRRVLLLKEGAVTTLPGVFSLEYSSYKGGWCERV